MGENSKIEWTDHTFNPWVGCQKISPACDHCYAEAWAKRAGDPQLWQGSRRRTTEVYWRQPLKWDHAAGVAGRRARVFCASLADVFDNVVPEQWRADLFRLIRATPNLDWLLLTKRIGNAAEMIRAAMTAGGVGEHFRPDMPWGNLWLGATVVNQEEADRDIPKLLATPASKRFLSIEPMLGAIDLRLPQRIEAQECCGEEGCEFCDGTGESEALGLHWVICGGESGYDARPLHPSWPRGIRDQCEEFGVPFLFKQWGQYLPEDQPESQRFSFETEDGRGASITFPDGLAAVRLHRKADAGRMLDSVTHDGFPA